MVMDRYNSAKAEVELYKPIPGAAGILLSSIATCTLSGNTLVTTLDAVGFGRPVVIKKLIFTVKTAATGVDTGKVVLYNNTNSAGVLTLTTQAALSVNTSSDLNSTVAENDYIRVQLQSIGTLSGDTLQIGYIGVTYVEQFA